MGDCLSCESQSEKQKRIQVLGGCAKEFKCKDGLFTKRCFHKGALKYHPDQNMHRDEAERRLRRKILFQKLNNCNETANTI